MKNANNTLTIILLGFGFFGVLPSVPATPESVPAAPLTALPGFNPADGDHALFNVTTGSSNSAFGWYALFADTDGSFNTGLGAAALALNNGTENTPGQHIRDQQPGLWPGSTQVRHG